jgi:hypothetical protein
MPVESFAVEIGPKRDVLAALKELDKLANKAGEGPAVDHIHIDHTEDKMYLKKDCPFLAHDILVRTIAYRTVGHKGDGIHRESW